MSGWAVAAVWATSTAIAAGDLGKTGLMWLSIVGAIGCAYSAIVQCLTMKANKETGNG